jgi:Family of unknown function (DUF6230)
MELLMASSDPQTPTPRGSGPGRVRLRRFAALAVPAGLAGAGLVVLTAQGVLAAQFSISGIPFTVTAKQMDGTGFEQFGYLDNTADGSPNLTQENGQELVMVSAIKSATLSDLCQSISIGGTYLVIRAGRGSTPVSATNLVVDSDQLSGNANFVGMSIGQDASTLDEVPGVTGPLGDFGQQSDKVTISNLRQDNYATTASSFTLPGMTMSFQSSGC